MPRLLDPPSSPGSDVRDGLPGLVWQFSPDRRECRAINEYGLQLLGFHPEAFDSADFWQSLVHPADLASALAATANILDGPTGDVRRLDYRLKNSRGRDIWIRESIRLMRLASGEAELVGIAVDLSDCMAEVGTLRARLRASEAAQQGADQERRTQTQLAQLLLDHSTDAIYMHDDDGRILEVNRVASEMLGMPREALIGVYPPDLDHSITRDQLATVVTGLDLGQTVTIETTHCHQDGHAIPVEIRLRPFWTGSRRNAVATVRDLTDQKRLERERFESHSLLQSIVEGTTDAIFVKDLDGRYQLINNAGAAFLGRRTDEVIGHSDAELLSPEVAAGLVASDRRVVETGETQTFEETVTAAGVARAFVAVKSPRRDADGQVIGIIGLSRDVTETRRLEEQFRQAQKMESVGRLAGGIAHDFNNLLTVINSGTELVLDQEPHDWPMRKLLAEVLKAGTRAATLTGQLLSFSRKQMLQPRPVSLSTTLTDLVRMLRRLLREDIGLALSLDDATAVAVVDRGQFEQAIMNLVVNARDAMPMGGRLTIGTSHVVLAVAQPVSEGELAAGHYVVVSVVDTGTGMDDTVRRQVFEPFFTTKGPGGGTGLGLAMVYGFVKQSGGHIEVSSQPGAGTTFRMFFPRQVDESPAVAEATAAVPPKPIETVLLVEAEPAVRQLTSNILRGKGYTVLDAANGSEAFAVARQVGCRVDLVVTDVEVADMSGRELVLRLSREHPSLRVMFMSGFTDESAVRAVVQAHQVAFLPKPFSPADFVQQVRELLDRRDRRDRQR